MDTVVDLLKEVKPVRVRSEQHSQHGQKPQRSVRRGVGGHPSVVRLQKDEMHPAGWVGRKFEVPHIHWRQLTYPFDQRLLALRVFADRLQHGRQIFAPIAQDGLTGESRFPHAAWHQVQKTHTRKNTCDSSNKESVLSWQCMRQKNLGKPWFVCRHLNRVRLTTLGSAFCGEKR